MRHASHHPHIAPHEVAARAVLGPGAPEFGLPLTIAAGVVLKVAMLERLLTDGCSPLYDDLALLQQELRRARHLIETGADTS